MVWAKCLGGVGVGCYAIGGDAPFLEKVESFELWEKASVQVDRQQVVVVFGVGGGERVPVLRSGASELMSAVSPAVGPARTQSPVRSHIGAP
jgi:hypothetical protein